MKSFNLVIILIFFLLSTGHSQSPGWSWVRSAGGMSNGNYAFSICNDANGNVYATGGFSDPFIVFGTDTLVNDFPGYLNFYIVKYDPSGNVLWAHGSRKTTVNDDNGLSISTDAYGNIYTTGNFESGGISFGSDTLYNFGFNNIFIVKYDPSGNLLWAQSAEGLGRDGSNTIGTDGGGNTYVSGYFDRTAISFGSITLTNAGIDNIFITKYDPAGNVVWAKSEQGHGNDAGYCICVNANGYISLAGSFTDSVSFDSILLANINGGSSIFVARMDTTINNATSIVAINSLYDSTIVYPNPSKDIFYFQGNKSSSAIEVYNCLGEKVYGMLTSNDNFNIDLTDQARGIYLYRITGKIGLIKQGEIILE